MNEKRIKDLLEFAKSTDLHELVWEKKNASVHFKRTPSGKALAARQDTSTPANAAASADESREPEPSIIRSTMVGTFFRSDAAGRPPLVVEGTVVQAGQSVGAIEAMKIMKDVLAPSPCKIVKALVANGHAVEYGQPLFEIEPSPQEANV
jgi:acetyl-CoA carboxylase biotin carboxyl carrier protein